MGVFFCTPLWYTYTMKKIKLINGGHTLVSDEDYEVLNKFRWRKEAAGGYILRTRLKKLIWMHRVILGLKIGEYTDHINGIRTDNRRENLRKCTLQQNLFNQGKQLRKTSSQFKGVVFRADRHGGNSHRWVARIALNGKRFHLGCFKHEKDAAIAYNNKAKELYGDFCRLNLV